MNTDDHLFIYLSNCLSQTQPDGVFQNQITPQINSLWTHPVPWRLALRHQPNWWEVVTEKSTGSSVLRGNIWPKAVVALTQKATHLGIASCWEKAPANISGTKASSKNFLWFLRGTPSVLYPLFVTPPWGCQSKWATYLLTWEPGGHAVELAVYSQSGWTQDVGVNSQCPCA